jgi:hypothetical protein
MKLTHIGENYPCLTDPNKGAKTSDNTSSINISPFNATISFLQLTNWGKYVLQLHFLLSNEANVTITLLKSSFNSRDRGIQWEKSFG